VSPANHQRYLFSRFRHIDEILGDALHALELSDETRLFPRAIRDATLGQELLPTGVTPVTAVPTRICHGAALAARAKIAGTAWREVPVAELADYVTELSNPGNQKRVLELVLEVPSARLSDSVYLIDTPGLGSFASGGAAQNLEYLPRCDLGIQLIEAGSAIAHEDLAVARAVLDGGSDLLIALSKADRLAPADLKTSVEYASELFHRELGIALQVRPMSIRGPQAHLVEEWFDQELLTRLSRFGEESRRLLRRKIGVLRETVLAVLAVRFNQAQKSSPPSAAPQDAPVNDTLSRLRAELDKARSDFLTLTTRVQDCTEWLVEGACEVLVSAWSDEGADEGKLARQLQEAIARRATEIADVVSDGLKKMHETLQRELTELFADEADELPRLRGRPPYDTEGLPVLASYRRPLWGFAHPLLTASAKQRIESAMLPELTERLSLYGEALKLWGTRYLDALGRRLEEISAVREAKDRSRDSGPASPRALCELERDLALLQT
jgi:hypothetical protein